MHLTVVGASSVSLKDRIVCCFLLMEAELNTAMAHFNDNYQVSFLIQQTLFSRRNLGTMKVACQTSGTSFWIL